MNGLTYAYIGDAYYEFKIREYLISKKITKVDELHKKAITFTSAKAQAKIVNYLMENSLLTTTEIEFFRNGRNASGVGSKNVDRVTYQQATGFEALIGVMYYHDQDRTDELIEISIEIIEKGLT